MRGRMVSTRYPASRAPLALRFDRRFHRLVAAAFRSLLRLAFFLLGLLELLRLRDSPPGFAIRGPAPLAAARERPAEPLEHLREFRGGEPRRAWTPPRLHREANRFSGRGLERGGRRRRLNQHTVAIGGRHAATGENIARDGHGGRQVFRIDKTPREIRP